MSNEVLAFFANYVYTKCYEVEKDGTVFISRKSANRYAKRFADEDRQVTKHIKPAAIVVQPVPVIVVP